jgi:hypothetical protein
MPWNIRWAPVLEHGKQILSSYPTGVTLRQLFYRLVADGTLPNTRVAYMTLSKRTAKARRRGAFPDLLDRTSRIERYVFFSGPEDARSYIRDVYRRDRTEGQEWTIYVGVEKDGMSEQLDSWFTEPLGIPHVALGGYASQTLCDAVSKDIMRQARDSVLIYAGDFDPTGIDIDRDFEKRVGIFDKVVRVALLPEQVEQYNLPHNPDAAVAAKLERDPRAESFRGLHGDLVQYEVDALPPEVLRGLYQTAIDGFWDQDAYPVGI